MENRPRAIKVEPIEEYKLIVTFSNSEVKIFDVKPYLDFVQFKELNNEEVFKSVKISGLSVEWDNGADICPDELYYDSVSVEA